MVCREKTKFRLPEHPSGTVSAEANYQSADKFKEQIKKKLDDEIPLGRIIGPGTKIDIANACNCEPDELVVGKLACIQEGEDKFRTLWDGSWGFINHQVKNPNQLESPGLAEEKEIMAWAQRRSVCPPGSPLPTSKFGMLKFDIKGAHRLVKKCQADWKYLAMQVDGMFYTNTVGTFGESTAAFWWSRVAGAVHRLLYYLGHPSSWGLIYADDSLWHLKLEIFWQEAALTFLFLSMAGIPVAWPKTRCGGRMSWVGFQIDTILWQCGVTETRRKLVSEKAKLMLQVSSVSLTELASLLGMLVHVGQALPQIRPLLQPCFALLHGVYGSCAHPKWSFNAKRAIQTIVDAVSETPMRRVWPVRKFVPGCAASDGSGGLKHIELLTEEARSLLVCCPPLDGHLVSVLTSGSRNRVRVSQVSELAHLALPFTVFFLNQGGIGGWWSDDLNPNKEDVFWFSETLPVAEFPWLYECVDGSFCAGGSSSTAVELLGITVLIDLRLEHFGGTGKLHHGSNAGFAMGSMADNKGCSFVLAKLYTKKMPGAAILRHMARVATARDISCEVDWVPREQNTWSDELSKSIFNGFDLAKRRRVNWDNYDNIARDVTEFNSLGH